MRRSRVRWFFVQLAFMDSGYAEDGVARATAIRREVVRKPKDQVGFAVGSNSLTSSSAVRPVELPRFRGRLAGRDQSFSAMVLASYSMGER